MLTSYDVIRAILRTEKSSRPKTQGQYHFEVAKAANKFQIKKAIEEIYKVKVAAVNTLVVAGKRKRVRRDAGHTPDWKKAVVTLQAGSKIDVT